MNRPPSNRLPILEIILIGAIILQAVLIAFEWIVFIKSPYLRYSDFSSFYIAGRIVKEGKAHQLYNFDLQLSIFDEILSKQDNPPSLGVIILPQHPHFLAPIYALIAVENYINAYLLWNVISLTVLIGCGIVVYKFLKSSDWSPRYAFYAALSTILFYPAALILIKGQDTSFVLLGFLLWMTGLLLYREKRAGFGLALGWIAPQITGVVALPFLASRRKAVWWFILACGVLMIYTILLIGREGISDFLRAFLGSTQGQDYSVNQLSMFNLLGLIRRNFPGIDQAKVTLLVWTIALLSIGCMCWYWWKRGKEISAKDIGLSILLTLFVSPHLHFHSLSLLILPWLGMAIQWGNFGNQRQMGSILFLSISSLVMLFCDLAKDPWRFIAAYILMFTLAAILLWPSIANALHRWRSRILPF